MAERLTAHHRRLLSYALSAAIVLALAAAVAVTVLGSAGSPATASTQESRARAEVQRVASSFAVNVNTYSSQKVGEYRKRVEPLLTPEFKQSFSRFTQGVMAQMKATRIESKGEVLVTGVSSIDRDSATVLVVADADVTNSEGRRARHFRWRVDLVREHGKWLVNEFQPT